MVKTSLTSLISDYGAVVDKGLITSIWGELGHRDPIKCRNIVHMLSGGFDANTTRSLTTTSDDQLSITSTEPSRTTQSIISSTDTAAALSATSEEPITSTEDLVNFLSACFPECGADYLRAKVDEIFASRSTGSSMRVDPVEAMDIISNTFYNDMETVDHQQYQGKKLLPDDSIEAIERQYSVSSAGSSKKKKRRGKGAVAHKNGNRSNSLVQPPPQHNAWDVISTELQSISNIFPTLSPTTVQSVYHKCNANIDQTTARLAAMVDNQTPVSKPTAKTTPSKIMALESHEKDISQTVETLSMIFADMDIDILEQAARATSNADAAAEMVLQMDAAQPKKPDSHSTTKWKRADLSRHTIANAARHTTETSGRDPLERVPLIDLASDARDWVQDHPAVDPARCRQRAQEILAQRNELYTKAARSYAQRGSKNHHSATALYYSIEGHQLDARARVWRMRAAFAMVAAMRRQDSDIVDLHGLTRAEAVAVVLSEAVDWYQRLDGGSSRVSTARDRPLHIVTGAGRHSADGAMHVHPSVVRALRENGWKIHDCAGYVDVVGKAR